MGVDVQTYRSRIGHFRQGNGHDIVEFSVTCNFSQALKQIGSVLFIGILLLLSGIEPNPGPLPEEDHSSENRKAQRAVSDVESNLSQHSSNQDTDVLGVDREFIPDNVNDHVVQAQSKIAEEGVDMSESKTPPNTEQVKTLCDSDENPSPDGVARKFIPDNANDHVVQAQSKIAEEGVDMSGSKAPPNTEQVKTLCDSDENPSPDGVDREFIPDNANDHVVQAQSKIAEGTDMSDSKAPPNTEQVKTLCDSDENPSPDGVDREFIPDNANDHVVQAQSKIAEGTDTSDSKAPPNTEQVKTLCDSDENPSPDDMKLEEQSNVTCASDDFERTLEKFDLKDCFPEKLSLQRAMTISEDRKKIEMKDIPWIILRKIIMLDFRARDDILTELLKKCSAKTTSKYGKTEIRSSDKINPLDFFLVLFSCCENMLQQIIMNKLSMCLLAFPFLYPSKFHQNLCFPIWCIRGLGTEWNGNDKCSSIVDAPIKIVSFVRLNRPKVSKSKYLNAVLGDERSKTFFNCDCPFGNTKRLLSDGMTEASLYLPSDKSQLFSELILFLNLRGDVNLYEKQLNLLLERSTVIVVFLNIGDVTERDLHTFKTINRSIYVVYVLAHSVDVKVDDFIDNEIIKASGKRKPQLVFITEESSVSDTRNEIRDAINELIKQTQSTSLAQFKTGCDRFKIVSDEDSKYCKEGNLLANKIITELQDFQVGSLKKMHLKTQVGKWDQYSRLLKQKQKSCKSIQKNEDIEKETSDILKEISFMCEHPTPLIKSFMDVLLDKENNKMKISYFIQWVKFFLDERSRKELPLLRQKFRNVWSEVKAAEEDRNEKDLGSLKRKALEAERLLSEASFGLEHIVRELGHLYESVHLNLKNVSEETKKKISYLPGVIADLLISGQCFELMDGDTGSVPIQWIADVMEQTEVKLNKRCKGNILAVSILGIQSSGKSTLLNTMFGLQLAVSAGRCTRGIFMQLIPVNIPHLDVDYLLLLDTEGLRAPELADQKYDHDNELATFVIGLGDITIVNVKGENTSEFKDILQIVIHAFLRLKHTQKKLKLNKSCVFIHQNVSDVRAKESLMHGQQTLTNVLDKMAKEAADQEDIADITTFKQVIHFDHDKHIWYFSDLWKGDPPMAPVNEGYSEMAEKVRKCIIEIIAPTRKPFLGISNMVVHIRDLWKGILGENFVFAFRNSLEVKAYNMMEANYLTLIWNLEGEITEWIYEEAIKCKQYEDNDKINDFISKTSTSVINIIVQKIQKLKTIVEEYFEKDELRDISIKWKQSRLIQIDIKFEELVSQSKLKIERLRAEQNTFINTRSTQSKHLHDINTQAEKLANKYQGKTKGIDLEKDFDNMYSKWVDQIVVYVPNKPMPMEQEIDNALQIHFQSELAVLEQCLEETPLASILRPNIDRLEGSLSPCDIKDKYLSITITKRYWDKVKGITFGKTEFDKCSKIAVSETDTILKKVDVFIEELRCRDVEFDSTYIKHILRLINNFIKDHNALEAEKHNFKMTPSFKIFLAVYSFRYCIPIFKQMNIAYDKKHSTKAHLESYRGTAWDLFKNIVDEKSNEVIIASLFCDGLKEPIYEKIKQDMPTKIIDRIYNQKFSCRKGQLILEILDELANSSTFKESSGYIKDSYTFALQYITKYTNEVIFARKEETESQYAKWAKSQLRPIEDILRQGILDAKSIREKQTGHCTIKCWVDNLNSCLKGFAIPAKSVDHLVNKNIQNFHSFERHVDERLTSLISHVLKNFQDPINPLDIKWEGQTPYETIMQKLWGCKAQCPFCHEPCSKGEENHYKSFGEAHTCTQHRIPGIRGIHYEGTEVLIIESCDFHVQKQNERFYCGVCDYECRKSGNCNIKEGRQLHLYIDYKKFVPEWDIPASSDMVACTYWKWFMVKFEKQILYLYGLNAPEIPDSWRSITKDEARNSLRKCYG